MSIKYQEIQTKSVINKLKYVDDWFWVRYTINPYRGCAHACEYCDARSHTYRTHADFDQTILVKTNAKEILEKEVERLKPDGVGIDGVADAYQSGESKFEITRKLLKVLREYNFPCVLDTKSDLVIRDLDIWQDIEKDAWAIVMFTITTFNEDLRRIFEPRAPSSKRRLRALERVKEAGIENVGIAFMPIIPYVLDTEENLEDVFKQAKEAGASFILVSAMSMKNRQRQRMMSLIADKFADLTGKYQALYAGDIFSAGDSGEYLRKLYGKLQKLHEKYKIADRVMRPIASWEKYPFNIRIAEALLVKAYRVQIAEGNSYKVWAYRKAGWSIYDLDKDIKELYGERGIVGLQQVPNVGKSIASMVERILPTIRV